MNSYPFADRYYFVNGKLEIIPEGAHVRTDEFSRFSPGKPIYKATRLHGGLTSVFYTDDLHGLGVALQGEALQVETLRQPKDGNDNGVHPGEYEFAALELTEENLDALRSMRSIFSKNEEDQ